MPKKVVSTIDIWLQPAKIEGVSIIAYNLLYLEYSISQYGW